MIKSLKSLLTVCLLIILTTSLLTAQPDFYHNFHATKADTLRGALRPERTCFDVHFYEIDIRIMPDKQAISGKTDVHFHAVSDFDRIQLDLYKNLDIQKVEYNGTSLSFDRQFNAFFVDFPEKVSKGTNGKVTVTYGGTPTKAANAPWDGGFVWDRDKEGNHWIGVACQGDGASLWWPNKDHLSEEPDSVRINVEVPTGLMAVSNGNMVAQKDLQDGSTGLNGW